MLLKFSQNVSHFLFISVVKICFGEVSIVQCMDQFTCIFHPFCSGAFGFVGALCHRSFIVNTSIDDDVCNLCCLA